MIGRLCIVVAWACLSSTVSAQSPAINDSDVVTVRGSQGTLDRKGEILDWRGETLVVRVGDRDREFSTEELIGVQTQWPAAMAEARRLQQAGDTEGSLAQYRAALEAESRPWAQRTLAAQMVPSLMVLEQPQSALAQFRLVIQEDPHSRFVRLAPLPWTVSSRPPAELDSWRDHSAPIGQLLGASWGLQGPQADQARQRLEGLANDLDPRIRAMAAAQLWRLRTNVTQKQLSAWQKLVDEMPASAGGGPRWVLADLQFQAGDHQAALLNWMQVVAWHQDELPLVAASLHRAARAADQLGKPVVATQLRDELNRRFPQSVWAQQAGQ